MKVLKTVLLLLLFSNLLLGQNHRFIYEYTFKIDSLNRDNITKELMNLDVTKEGSKFYSHKKYIYDSANNAELMKAKKNQAEEIVLGKYKNGSKVSFSVSKKYPSFETTLHTSLDGGRYAILEQDHIKWELTQEKSEVAGYKVQKATTDFLGRKWMAWFTPEIQIQDGPYKFTGLPGLILKVEDEKGDHIFNFIGSKNINGFNSEFDLDLDNYKKESLITKEKFRQLWKDYERDPARFCVNIQEKLYKFATISRL